MINQFFNGMLTLMLAKFMLNDVPHMLDSDEGGHHKREEYEAVGASPLWLARSHIRLRSTAPNLARMIRRSSTDFKTVICGYNDIANAVASDTVVDDVSRALVRAYNKFAGEHEWQMGDVLDVEDWDAKARSLNYGDRADKAIAIDAIMHAEHMSGLVLEGLFPDDCDEDTTTVIQQWLRSLAGAEKIIDTRTGIVYPSKRAAATAVAAEYGLDPSSSLAWYEILKVDPSRLKLGGWL